MLMQRKYTTGSFIGWREEAKKLSLKLLMGKRSTRLFACFWFHSRALRRNFFFRMQQATLLCVMDVVAGELERNFATWTSVMLIANNPPAASVPTENLNSKSRDTSRTLFGDFFELRIRLVGCCGDQDKSQRNQKVTKTSTLVWFFIKIAIHLVFVILHTSNVSGNQQLTTNCNHTKPFSSVSGATFSSSVCVNCSYGKFLQTEFGLVLSEISIKIS